LWRLLIFSWRYKLNLLKHRFLLIVLLANPAVTPCGFSEEVLPDLVIEGESTKSSITGPSLSGNALFYKAGSTLGDSLSNELGMSSSAFGASANRPIIRGMSGSRAPILENGLSSGDVSSISNDHAVTSDPLFTQKLEILRGSEALRFASGSPNGLINITNARIPEQAISTPEAQFVSEYGSNNQSYTLGLMTEQSIGKWALHLDASHRDANNYTLPSGVHLPFSFGSNSDMGFGASFQRSNGYTGFSIGQYSNYYGIPSINGSKIDLTQNRYELKDFERNPMNGIEKIETKLGYTNYHHTEISPSNIPQSIFNNSSFDARIELFHEPFYGWKGSYGLQLSSGTFAAFDLTNPIFSSAVIPETKSNSIATFISESKSIQEVDIQLGGRLEKIVRSPNSSIPYTDSPNFITPSHSFAPSAPLVAGSQFSLFSVSSSAFWNYTPSYALGLSYSITSRAPSIDELYSYGNHDATGTFDVGNSQLSPETSYQFELGWKKTRGSMRSQVNIFQSTVSNYIYALYTGASDTITNYPVRQFLQSNATIRGAEGELSYHPESSNWSGRIFADGSGGNLSSGGNLPLQPAIRVGSSVNFIRGPWESTLTWVHAMGQNRLASFETYPTPAYDRLDFRFAYFLNPIGSFKPRVYFKANNLLNQEIRYSTTVEDLRINAPLPGRSFILGLRVDY